MTTVEELIDTLETTPRGQAFLINLYHTIESGFISALQVRALCEEFISVNTAGGHPPRPVDELVERLGESCVDKDLWQEGPEPILERHLKKREFVLSRIASYSGFYYSILNRAKGMPPIDSMPEPINLLTSSDSEIAPTNVRKVRNTINNGKWKALLLGNVKLSARCIWMTSLPRLKEKINVATKKSFNADSYRDTVGLSHFSLGRHLIRLDFNLGQWPEWRASMRRRPHGAGNGGNRFRLKYDGPESVCRWGRTVDLALVAANNTRTLNGIPELLLEGFSIPKTAVNATYLGPLQYRPENNDSFFITRLRRKQTISNVIAALKSILI